MHRFHLFITIVAGAATAVPASAGTLIVGTYTGTRTPNGRTVEFRIQDGLGKITGNDGQSIYYDHAKRTAYVVDTQKGTSFAMNEARAKQVAAQLADAQRQMEAKLKELPPEKRAMLEKMMKEQGAMSPGGAPRAPLEFSKAGSAKVGAWSCDRYSASGDGREVAVCAAEPDALGIPTADVAVFEGFLDLSEKMAGQADASSGERSFPGLPLERSESREGKVTDRFTIERIETQKMSAADLRVPAGLKDVEPGGARPPK